MACKPEQRALKRDRRSKLAKKTVESLLGEARIRDLFDSYEQLVRYTEKNPDALKKLGMDAKAAWAKNPVLVD